METSKNTRWGIIGLGKIASTFAKDLQFVPDSVLQAVASRTLDTAEKFKTAHNAKQAYGSYEALAKDSNIDVVYIATPHVFHFENAKLCIEQGKSVLCEKPMCMSADDVLQLQQLAIKNNVLLMEALWTNFLPNFNVLKKLVFSEELGKIISFKADFGFKANFDPSARLFNKKLGGGSVLDIGIYPIFACLTLLGKPLNVSAKATIGKTNIDENCTIKFKYSESLTADLYCTLIEDTPTELSIEFEKGTATLGPKFHQLSDLKIIDHKAKETFHSKYSEGTGYQFEAIHMQELLDTNQKESPLFTHQKSFELATYLDKVLQDIELTY